MGLMDLFNLSPEMILGRVGDWLDGAVDIFDIDQNGESYLKRWYLFRQLPQFRDEYPDIAEALEMARSKIGAEIYLHRIRQDDSDRDLHDHPWNFLTFILSGGYIEEVPRPGTTGWDKGHRIEITRSAGSFTYRPAESIHRVKLFRDPMTQKPVESWSLVLRGRKLRDWGFWTKDGWVPHEKYLDHMHGKGNWVREPGFYDEPIFPG